MSDPEDEHLDEDVDTTTPAHDDQEGAGNAAIDQGMAAAMGAGAAAGGEPDDDASGVEVPQDGDPGR